MTTYGLACLWNEYESELHRYMVLMGMVMKAPTPKTETDVIASLLRGAGYTRSDDDLKPLPADSGGPERDALPVYERWTDHAEADISRPKQTITTHVCEKVIVGPNWLTFYTLARKGEVEAMKSIKKSNLNAIRQYVKEGK